MDSVMALHIIPQVAVGTAVIAHSVILQIWGMLLGMGFAMAMLYQMNVDGMVG